MAELENMLQPSIQILRQQFLNTNSAVFFAASTVFDMTLSNAYGVKLCKNIGSFFKSFEVI